MKNLLKIIFLIIIGTSILYPVVLQNKTSSSLFEKATTGFLKEDEKIYEDEKLIITPTVTKPERSLVKTENQERLVIPSIQVNAAIESLGLTPDGEMATPKGIHNVGWYNLGTPIGHIGSAVIAGHLDGNTGKSAVFYNLSKLKKGDTINYLDKNGEILTFIVREIRTYNMDADASDIFISETDRHLNLITCSGLWNKYKKKYEKRLVVFSDLYYTQ